MIINVENLNPFQTRYTISNKVCDMIINVENQDNLVSNHIMKALGLQIKKVMMIVNFICFRL